MTAKITTLTPEQEHHLCDVQAQWIALGQSTAPTNEAAAEEAMAFFYAQLDKPRPLFVWCDSPFESSLFPVLLRENGICSYRADVSLKRRLQNPLVHDLLDVIQKAARDHLNSGLHRILLRSRYQWEELLEDRLRETLFETCFDLNEDHDLLSTAFGGMLNAALGTAHRVTLHTVSTATLDPTLDERLHNTLRFPLNTVMHDSLYAVLHVMLYDTLYDTIQAWHETPWSQKEKRSWHRKCIAELTRHWHSGTHDGAWIAFYSFLADIGVPYTPKDRAILDMHTQYAQAALWANSYEKICFLVRRPVICHMIPDTQGRLVFHADGGPAYAFADGSALWALHGVRVSQEIAETPADQLDPRCFATEPNVEIRREILRKLGIERIIQGTGATVLDQVTITHPAGPPLPYELLRVPLGGETGEWPYLKMWNPSEQCWHIEAVPQHCRTVQEALDFRNRGDFLHLAPLS